MPSPPMFVLIAALIAAILLFERIMPASPSQRGEWLNNIIVFLVSMLARIAVGPVLAIATSAAANAAGGGLIDLTAWPLALGAVTYLVAQDLGEYLFHRAQHVFPWMWAMHSLHHSDQGMNVGTSQRHFWLEPALKTVSIWLVVGLLFKINAGIASVYFVVSLYHLFAHANVRVGFGPLSWVWNSPQYHRLHHSRDPRHFNANFAALLPIFDLLSGAYRRPAAGEYPDTGLDDEAVMRPIQLIVWPVRGVLERFGRPAAVPAGHVEPGSL